MRTMIVAAMICLKCGTDLVQVRCPQGRDGCAVWHGACPKCTTEKRTMDIKESGRLNLDVIRASGFDEPTWDNLPQKLVLTYTEVTEAEAAVLGHFIQTDPLAEELADIAIRVTGMLWGIWGDDWSVRAPDGLGLRNPFQPIEVMLRPIRDYLTHAVEAWRKDRRVDVKVALELVLKETAIVAETCEIDLVAEMEVKRAKNAARPPRHGNKRSDG